MASLLVRKSKLTDIPWVIERMSDEDKRMLGFQEIEDIPAAFRTSMVRSYPHANTVCEVLPCGVDALGNLATIENPMACFGVVSTPLEGDARRIGQIWCVATEELRKKRWREFTIGTKRYLDGLMKEWDILYNLESEEAKTHIRWLQKCGFQTLRTIPYGSQGLPYIQFARFR